MGSRPELPVKVESKGLEQTAEVRYLTPHDMLGVLCAYRMLNPYYRRPSYRRQAEGGEGRLDTTSGLGLMVSRELFFVGQSTLLRTIP